MEYLKDDSYYTDLYDLLTIKRCLRAIQFWQKAYKEKSDDKEIKHLPKEEKIKGFQYFLNSELFAIKTEEYRRRQETIQKWIDTDKKEQEKYDNTPEPRGIHCSDCGTLMRCTFKHLEDYLNQPLRVLFFFECPSCKKRKGVYEDGQEDIPKPQLCPKCKKEVKTKHTKKANVITWVTKCSNCGFSEKQVDDFDKKKAEREQKEREDKELLEKYQNEFCLSDEKGKESIELIEKMKYANEAREEEMRKYDNSIYQRAIQLKKVGIVELEKILNEVLSKENYIKLLLDKPEIERYVIVPFTVQDADSTRKGFDSTSNLQKIIKDALEDTNWRLLSGSLSYRLGYLEGRLKGYEQEEDMMELAGKKKEQKPLKYDFESRSKYEGDPMVQLARMMGKQQAIENLRKKRLEKEPDGFALEEEEGKYNCRICHEMVSGRNAWWNLGGVRCLDCQRNIKEGVIPEDICQKEDLWIKGWQLTTDYSIRANTAKKLLKEGVLKGRELKRENGTVYYSVYSKEENKEFLKRYPKKPKIKMTYVDPQGNKAEM